MTNRTPKLRSEFGDIILWVSFDNEKPFPTNIYRKGGVQETKVHPHRELSEEEQALLDDFLAEKLADIVSVWPDLFETRLNWPRTKKKQ